jgi:hypothetical protein
MDEMSSREKFDLPYTLFLDPVTGRAAAYTQNHRLITHEASARLVAWGQANAVQTADWDDERHDPASNWRPLPAWATPEVRGRALLLWVRKGSTADEVLRAMPRR